MSNPYTILRQAVQAELANVTGIGETRKMTAEQFDKLAAYVGRRRHSVAWCRISGSGRMQSDQAAYVAEEIMLHAYLGAYDLASAETASDAAEELMWTVRDLLQDNTLDLGWLRVGLQFREWEDVYATSTVTIYSLIFATAFDHAEYSA